MKSESNEGHTSRIRTFVEWALMAIAIMFLLAVLLPVRSSGRHTKIITARMEMADLAQALESYELNYGHLPIVNTNSAEDASFGILRTEVQDFKPVKGTRLIAS